jgi:uncharacterized membrane protein YkoI
MLNERRGVAALIALTLAVSLAAGPVHGKDHKRRGQRTQLAQAEISADRAAAIARNATGGRVLKVQRKNGVYQVRVLLDGERVRNVSVDARTGRVLN